MKRSARVLVIDDQSNWRRTIERTLIQDPEHTFLVDTADTPESARERLAKGFYHVTILDIRLRHNDQDDAGGMTILEEIYKSGLTDAMDVVMLSGHGTHLQMRDALARYQATDYILKETYDNLLFLELIRGLTHDSTTSGSRTRFHKKLALDVYWQGGLRGAQHAILGVKVNGERISEDSPLHETMSAEIDDLICRLFHNAEEVILYPLIRGMSGAGVLRAVPRFDEGIGGHRVVKFGDVHQIEAEKQNYETYVRNLATGNYATNIVTTARTPRLGGIIYSFLGGAGQQLDDFGTLFLDTPVEDLDQILNTLRQIYTRTCASWFVNPDIKARSLSEHYHSFLNIDQETLSTALDNIKDIRVTPQGIYFNGLGMATPLTNPLALAQDEGFVEISSFCTTHGDLNERNILVDNDGHTWLIDFRHTGKGHLMRDFASLEVALRFELLAVEDITLQHRYEMEQLLDKVRRYEDYTALSSTFSGAHPLLHKVFEAIIALRECAGDQVKGSPHASLREYQIALFFCTLNALRFKSLSNLQRQHVLLTACILAEQLQ